MYMANSRPNAENPTRWGLASGITQILALGNAKIHQHVGISNAKFWRQGHCPMPTPDARYNASQWNIGFSPRGRLGPNRVCRKVKDMGPFSASSELNESVNFT